MFQPSWASALIQFHPEYKLYTYSTELCSETFDITTPIVNIPETVWGTVTTPAQSIPSTTIALSSDAFDSYLRDNVFTLAQARGTTQDVYVNDNFYAIDVIGTTQEAIYSTDPYFHIAYTDLHQLNNIALNILKYRMFH